MADIQISREAVEAAARALAESDTPPKKWEDLQPSAQYRWAVRAKAVLAAGAQFVVADELERMANSQSALARRCPCTERTALHNMGPHCINLAHSQAVQRFAEYSARAAELRAQS